MELFSIIASYRFILHFPVGRYTMFLQTKPTTLLPDKTIS